MELLKIIFPIVAFLLILGGVLIPWWYYKQRFTKPPDFGDFIKKNLTEGGKVGDFSISDFLNLLNFALDYRFSDLKLAFWQIAIVQIGIFAGLISLGINLLV